jgi:LmbE family N-acetylglucosaminyl deacetylase/CheY-like chemotaxis protein
MTAAPEGAGRILVVEDDPSTRRFVVRALQQGGFDVVDVGAVMPALELLASGDRIDALLADIGLPGQSGFDLVDQVKQNRPHLPIALMTADASTDVAVRALRSKVDDFLAKPIAPDQLVQQVRTLVELGRRHAASVERVLAVGAHPDDVEIGVGGILLAHHAAGDQVTVMTLSHGSQGGDREERAGEAARAAHLLGADLELCDLEDTHISESNPTVGLIEAVVARIEPTIVYVHTINDLHQDHRNVNRATMVAARRVPSLYCYESPSTTVDFRPARFVSIEGHLDAKLGAIDAYASQVAVRAYLEEELVRATSRYWGRYGGARYCEPLEVVRERSSGAAHGGGAAVGLPAAAPMAAEVAGA